SGGLGVRARPEVYADFLAYDGVSGAGVTKRDLIVSVKVKCGVGIHAVGDAVAELNGEALHGDVIPQVAPGGPIAAQREIQLLRNRGWSGEQHDKCSHGDDGEGADHETSRGRVRRG